MLPIRYDKLYTPPSSPASVSSSWPNSSSPPSSPGNDPLSLDTDDEEHWAPPTRVADPLAGSYNGNRQKRTSKVFTPPATPSKKPRFVYNASFLDDDVDAEETRSSADDLERAIWDDAVEKVFATHEPKIDLSSCGLTYIPPKVILDLSKYVVLPGETLDDCRIVQPLVKPHAKRVFARFQTAPAATTSLFGSAQARQKSASSSQVLSGTSMHQIDMYLSNNGISKLPTELSALKNLRILSLRNNRIGYLPPEIAKLENLVDLNVALNRLKFLPSELTRMSKLTKLIVLPNPFLPETVSRVSETRHLGSRVPPLTELALRVLLSPPVATWPPEVVRDTVLEHHYMLPIPTGAFWRPISSPVRQTLATCVPGAITTDQDIMSPKTTNQEVVDEVTGAGRCPNPVHGDAQAVFVQHLEERFTWVDTIAGIKLGGVVPLRWRGCERGCLDFLDPPKDEPVTEIEDEDLGDAVLTVQFAATELDFDD